MAPTHQKLDRPIALGAMSDENIAEAFKAIAGLPLFEGDQVQVSLQTEFGEHPSSVDAVAELLAFFRQYGPFLTAKIMILREKKGVASVIVQRITGQLTATVETQLGLEPEAGQQLATKMSELFPFRPLDDVVRDKEIERMKLEFSNLVALAQQRAHDLEELLEGSRGSVRESEIKHHAKVFQDEATEHQGLARWCLGFAFASFLLLLAVAIGFFLWPINVEASVVGQILARLTLISIPATGLGVAVRQYSVARHNWVVARHRSNALGSYVAFALAIQNSAKDALLTQALSLIFSPQATGYSKAAAASDSIAPFTELMKHFNVGKS